MSTLSPVLAYLAGALTILSPCVLPLVPIVLGSAAQQHKWGPLALTLGLVVSFTSVGFFVALLGAASAFNADNVRFTGAVILLLAGLALLIPRIQLWLSQIATPFAHWASTKQSGLERFGLIGQAAIGILLGLVWSPCVGPTLGAATVLAAQGRNLASVTLIMLAFALGIASVLLLLALATRTLLSRWRMHMLSAGHGGRRILGVLLTLVSLLILTGGDHIIEGYLISISPDWLITAATSV
jgi:cytochrome c biogenesis protein CcdA